MNIKRAGRFVQDQDLKLVQDGTGLGNALTLATRQVDATLADQRLIALRQVFHKFVRANARRRLPSLIHHCSWGFERNVFRNAAIHQARLLQHQADAPPEQRRVDQAGNVPNFRSISHT